MVVSCFFLDSKETIADFYSKMQSKFQHLHHVGTCFFKWFCSSWQQRRLFCEPVTISLVMPPDIVLCSLEPNWAT